MPDHAYAAIVDGLKEINSGLEYLTLTSVHGIFIFVTFSAILQLSHDLTVASGGANWKTFLDHLPQGLPFVQRKKLSIFLILISEVKILFHT